MERTAIQLQQMNYELREEKEQFKIERETGTHDDAGSSTESDREGPSQERGKREVPVGTITRKRAESDEKSE
jgi:hypothetical protein